MVEAGAYTSLRRIPCEIATSLAWSDQSVPRAEGPGCQKRNARSVSVRTVASGDGSSNEMGVENPE
jgi:hypothetical protein